MGYLMIWQRKKKFLVAGNHKYKEPNLSSVVGNPVEQNELISHLLWVTL